MLAKKLKKGDTIGLVSPSEEIRKDFFTIWERTDNKFREKTYIINWIDEKIRVIKENEDR